MIFNLSFEFLFLYIINDLKETPMHLAAEETICELSHLSLGHPSPHGLVWNRKEKSAKLLLMTFAYSATSVYLLFLKQ